MGMDTKKDQHKCTSIPDLGVHELWQGLFLLPSKYVDLSHALSSFAQIGRNASVVISARVVKKEGYTRDKKPTKSLYPAVLKMILSDGRNMLPCETFRAKEWISVDIGDTVTIMANVKSGFAGTYLASPEIINITPYPRVDYRGISGKISGDAIQELCHAAVVDRRAVAKASAWFSNEKPALTRLILKHWGPVSNLLTSLHAPKSMKEAQKALAIARRLCVAEVRYNGRLSAKRAQEIAPSINLRFAVWDAIKSQPETLSTGQLEALKIAIPALSGNVPARVLLNGDVGSGKTLVFLSIVAGFAMLGKFGAIMAPNENVAAQIHAQFQKRFPHISCKYVAGSSSDKTTSASVWIGTTALIFSKNRPEFDIVVVDEMHKFARRQREALLSPHSHLIEASATPIPRSLAIALFDGCVLAQISTPPVNRVIHSHLLGTDDRHVVASLHRKAINNGMRVIYLYAAVNKSKSKEKHSENEFGTTEEDKEVKPIKKPGNIRAAQVAFDDMEKAFPGRVALVHGQMSQDNATAALNAFRTGDKPILIASTAIEVGVDVPDVALMVVSNPERFGAAQLHQIRGRLIRNGGEANFVMHTTKKLAREALMRLSAVRDIQDGFALAERDLHIRGFGDVAGDMQSGATNTTFQLSQITSEDFLRKRK